jgi:hypothetical protein
LLAGLVSLAALASLGDDGRIATRGRAWTLALAVAAACLCKESAFVLPLVAACWAAALAGRWSGGCARVTAWAAAGMAVALFARYETLGYLVKARESALAEAGGPLGHLLLVGRAIATYAQALVFPWGTVGPAHFTPRPIGAGDLLGWVGVVIGGCFVAATVFAALRRPRTGLLLAAFAVSIAPVIQVVPLDLAGGLHAADRFAYLPSFFLVAAAADLAVARMAAAPGTGRRAAIGAVALVAAFAAGRTAVLPRWNDAERFWTWAVDMAPASPVARVNLAYVLLAAGKPGEAEIHASLGGDAGVEALVDALAAQGRGADAMAEIDGALARRPRHARWLAIRGESCAAAGRTDEATVSLGGAEHAADAHDGPTWLRIARGWIAACDVARARSALDVAVRAGADGKSVADLRETLSRLAAEQSGGGD